MEESRATLEPQRRLLLAILEDAIYCFLRFEPGARQKELALFTEAEEWIFQKEENRIFSFESVCEALQIDPDYLRKGLRLRQRGQLRDRSQVKIIVRCSRSRRLRVSRQIKQSSEMEIGSGLGWEIESNNSQKIGHE